MSDNITTRLIKMISDKHNTRPLLVLLPAWKKTNFADMSVEGIYTPAESFVSDLTTHILEDGEPFIEQARSLIKQQPNDNYFIVSPLLSSKFLSDDLRESYPRQHLEQIIFRLLLQELGEGALAGFLLPNGLLMSKRFLSTLEPLRATFALRLMIQNLDSAMPDMYGIRTLINLSILFVEKGARDDKVVRFFRIPTQDASLDASQVVSDFARLLRQNGGATRFGYVLRDGVPDGSILSFDLYHPELVDKQRQIGHYGEVRALGDFFEHVPGLHTAANRNLLLSGTEGAGIPVIGGRDIRRDGTINYDEVRFRITQPTQGELKANDICLRRISSEGLCVAVVQVDAPPAVTAESVIVLRPKAHINTEDMELLVEFLRSEIAQQFLAARSAGINVLLEDILAMPILVFDSSMRLAVQGINDALQYFKRCQAEAESAKSALFNFSSAKEARAHVLDVGRRVRQRKEAASLVDDTSYRFRTQLPHPIAYRWRTIETEQPGLQAYVQILECAEVIVCYLASFAIASAAREGIEISYVIEMRKRLSSKAGHGTNMGDWIAIVREMRDSKQFRAMEGAFPVPELIHSLRDQDADEALQALVDKRNDQAHGRGPKGDAQIAKACSIAVEELRTLLDAVEFLSEYPLRFIEATRRDSITRMTTYRYRDLMGDHPLTSIRESIDASPEIEANSLYFLDRAGRMHLLRPLLNRLQCAECGNWATFYLDRFNVKTRICTLKSMESYERHAIDVSEVVPAFQAVGLVSIDV